MPVGISDIGLYVPSPMMEVNTVIQKRILSDPRLNRHLQRAVRVTGHFEQRKIVVYHVPRHSVLDFFDG